MEHPYIDINPAVMFGKIVIYSKRITYNYTAQEDIIFAGAQYL